MVRCEYPLPAEKILELGHHILRAHLYKGMQMNDISAVELQAYWASLSTDNLSSALSYIRNIFSPNVKVSTTPH